MLGIVGASFSGHLGGDAELKKWDNGTEYLSFSVAVKQNKDDSQWIGCALTGPSIKWTKDQAKKGALVVVSGADIKISKTDSGTYFNAMTRNVNVVPKTTTAPTNNHDDIPF